LQLPIVPGSCLEEQICCRCIARKIASIRAEKNSIVMEKL
jgi:hypothetical protein